MPKKSFQDVVKVKTIKRHKIPTPPAPVEIEIKKNGPKRYTIWLVAVLSIVFLIFALSFLFAKAKVVVHPKVQEITLNKNFTANKDSTAGLSFDLVVISGEESKNVEAGAAEDVSSSAMGKVFIYNTTSASQVLSKDTKLEGSNGKIYKTVSKVTVPKLVKVGQPGKVEASIYASAPGDTYNSTPLDFKILGFKGTVKYTKFYARSEGEINGGLSGKYYKITDAEKESVVSGLESALSAKLLKKATDQIPPGFILFKDAIFLRLDDASVENIANASSKDSTVPISLKGTLYGFLFNEKKLTEEIVKKTVGSSGAPVDLDVHIPGINNLSFSLPAQAGLTDKNNVSFADVTSINFSLSGPVKIVSNVDSSKLSSDLLGKGKKDFNGVLSTYPSINSADVTIRPFWKMSFPEKIKNIEILVKE